jgi:class 3 adenylate cyclase/tetratricopeptide (TPR) repeat protein
MDSVSSKSQRRNLAILFSDLCESTRISGSLEPEQFAALLEQLRGLYDAIISRHGGLIVRIDGDGVTCAFGYPDALDDAGRRATEAALDLHAAVATLDQSFAFPDVSIRLHSGVHSGVVLVREGDMVRGRIEILGDTTNVAARLCDYAEADQIVVSEASLGGDRHFFTANGEVAVPVKGRKATIAALLISGRGDAATRFAARSKRGMAPFCGREAELERLRELLDQSRSDGARQAIVIGQAGIGKTRLLSEFLDLAARDGIAVHRGYCEAYLGARPLQPFEQIAQTIGDTAAEGDIPAGVLHWARETAGRPAIVAIDDWQWADDASHMLLGEIVRARPSSLLILLASRPEGVTDPDLDGIARIDLGPLSESESDAAIAGLLQASDPFRAERIRTLSGGSPLFIEELCHAQTAHLPGQEPSDSSAWLDTLVHARFLELPERQAGLVRTASVIGHMVPLGLFAAVTGIGAGDPVLSELSASDFLYHGDIAGTLRFKHALTRDAIYRTVGFEERNRLHRLVAERLEALAGQEGEGDYVDALAYHHAACGNSARAIAYAIKAGDRAMALAALDRAQSHFRLALELLGNGSDNNGLFGSLIVRFGRASVVDPSREQLPVLEAAATIARQTGNGEAVMLAEYWLGAIYYGLGDASDSIQHLEVAKATLPPDGRPGFEAQLLGNLGQSHAIASNYSIAKDFLSQSIAVKSAARMGDAPATGMAYSYACRAYLDAVRGQFGAANAGFDSAMAALKGAYHPVISSILALRALSDLLATDYDSCLIHIREAIEVSSQSRARYLLISCRAIQDYANWLVSGDLRHVEALEICVEWLTKSSSRQRVSNKHSWLAEIYATLGRHAEAEAQFELACQRADAGDRLGEALACRAMASLAATGKAPLHPEHYLDRAWRSAELREAPREAFETDLRAAEIYRILGDAEQSQRLFDRAIAGFRSLGMNHRVAAIEQLARANP